MSDNNDKTVNIFISFKSEYEATAEKFQRILSRYGGKNIKINVSKQIAPGSDWRKWIKDALEKSHVLILLYTAPTATWDWCLYEVGLFRKAERPVICFHNPKYEPPEPLKDFQNVKADLDSIKRFLKDFYCTTKITGAEDIINDIFEKDDNELNRAAEEIKELFGETAATTQYINHYLKLFVKDRKRIQENKIPDDAIIESNSSSLELFGLAQGEWTWKDIDEVVKQMKDSQWVEELSQAVFQASQKRIPAQIKGCFTIQDQEKTYRPALYRVDYGADDSIWFYILFVME